MCRVHEAHAFVKLDKKTGKAFIRPGEKDCRLLVNGSPISEEVRLIYNLEHLNSYNGQILCSS